MTTMTVIMMIVILGFVWGGLACLVAIGWRKEGAKRAARDAEPS